MGLLIRVAETYKSVAKGSGIKMTANSFDTLKKVGVTWPGFRLSTCPETLSSGSLLS